MSAKCKLSVLKGQDWAGAVQNRGEGGEKPPGQIALKITDSSSGSTGTINGTQ